MESEFNSFSSQQVFFDNGDCTIFLKIKPEKNRSTKFDVVLHYMQKITCKLYLLTVINAADPHIFIFFTIQTYH